MAFQGSHVGGSTTKSCLCWSRHKRSNRGLKCNVESNSQSSEVLHAWAQSGLTSA